MSGGGDEKRDGHFLHKVARFRALRGTAIRVQKRFEQALHAGAKDPRELERLQHQAGECWAECGRARSQLRRAKNETNRLIREAA